MSSCPLCRYEKNSCERTSNTAAQYPSWRTPSARRKSKPSLQEILVRLLQESVAFAILIICGIVILLYDPFHDRALALTVLDEDGSDLGKETNATLRAYFCKLAKLGRGVTGQRSILTKITTRIASLIDTLHIPRFLEDPSPQLFLAACLVFAFGVAMLQYWHKNDKHLNKILLGGIVVGCAAAFRTTNPWMEMKSYLAWSIILALLLSILVHLAIRLWQGPGELDDVSEMEVRLCDVCCEQKGGGEDVVRKASDMDEIRGN